MTVIGSRTGNPLIDMAELTGICSRCGAEVGIRADSTYRNHRGLLTTDSPCPRSGTPAQNSEVAEALRRHEGVGFVAGQPSRWRQEIRLRAR